MSQCKPTLIMLILCFVLDFDHEGGGIPVDSISAESQPAEDAGGSVATLSENAGESVATLPEDASESVATLPESEAVEEVDTPQVSLILLNSINRFQLPMSAMSND